MDTLFHNNFIVISGGPGAGKTALIRELEHRGYNCVAEVARALITEEVNNEGTALPWKDKERYKQLMLERSVVCYRNAPAESGLVFFDRGIPDTICYAALEGLALTKEMEQYAMGLRYHKKIFLLPPWQAIYQTDTERKQSWPEAVRTYVLMKQTYINYGYEPVGIPPAPVSYRAEMVIKSITEGKD
jgi:predicted ATPase